MSEQGRAKRSKGVTQRAQRKKKVNSDDLKKLTATEIECLLGIRESDQHALELLGYDFTTKGQKRFKSERPNPFQQISEYIASALQTGDTFPVGMDLQNPGAATFILRVGVSFKISSLEEIGIGKYQRFESDAMTQGEAIRKYVREVANPDYIAITD